MAVLDIIARLPDHERVLILWNTERGVVVLHQDGALTEHALTELRVDFLEANARLALNEQQNKVLLEQVAHPE